MHFSHVGLTLKLSEVVGSYRCAERLFLSYYCKMCSKEIARMTLELVRAFTSHGTAEWLNFLLCQEKNRHFPRGEYIMHERMDGLE